MHINDLPDHILEDIFYIHVYVYRQSRDDILYTCRKWYNITNNHSSLWRTIAFHATGQMPPVKLDVYSLKGLAQLVNRVGDATFNLILGCPFSEPEPEEVESFKSSVPKDWLSRCHTFTLDRLEQEWRVPDTKTMGDLLHSYNYEGLERLEILYMGTPMWEHILERLMDRVEQTSPNLHSLKVYGGLDIEQFVKSVLGRPSVLARIRNFSCYHIGVPLPWEAFPNLEELTFTAINTSSLEELAFTAINNPNFEELTFTAINTPNLPQLAAPLLTKLSLAGHFATEGLPWKVFNQLTHLNLQYFKLTEANIRPLQLPSLLSLALTRTEFNLRLISAPRLEHFEYTASPWDEIAYEYPSFEGAVFQPRVIRLDVLSDKDKHDPFGMPLQMWKKCEELHLVTFREFPEIGETLTDALSGRTDEQCWLELKCVTVLYPATKGDTGPTRDEKKSKVEGALRIQESRVRQGLKPSERLEVGWYWTNDNEEVLEEPSREWWVTTWVDCLH